MSHKKLTRIQNFLKRDVERQRKKASLNLINYVFLLVPHSLFLVKCFIIGILKTISKTQIKRISLLKNSYILKKRGKESVFIFHQLPVFVLINFEVMFMFGVSSLGAVLDKGVVGEAL